MLLEKRETEAIDLENKRAIEEASITSDFERESLRLEQQYQMEVANAEKTGADISLIESKYAQIREKREKELVNAKLQMTADIAGQISNIMGQESEAGKAFALAQATINTYLGASKAIAQGGIWGVAQAAIVIAAGLKQVASIMKVKEEVPKTNTSVKKFAKGGTVFGAPHSQGGVTFTGSNGQQFEAEGGENMYILNKRASHAINALSALNQQYGGRSFGLDVVEFFAARNAEISIVEMMDQIGRDLDPVTKNDMKDQMKKHHVAQLTKTALQEVKDSSFLVKDAEGERELPFDYGFVCLGMRAQGQLFAELSDAFVSDDVEILNIGDSKRARRIIDGTLEGRNILNTLTQMGYLQ